MGRPKANKFSLMSEQEIMEFLRDRYQRNGIGSLSYVSIKKEKGLYFHLYKKGLKIEEIIRKLSLEKEYSAFKTNNFTKIVNGKVHRRWSWKRIIEEAEPIVKANGFLPPAQWFQNNKLGSLVFSVYSLGMDWNDLRAHFDSYENSVFVQSRNGLRWRSHPEASLSNFLYARGIEHKKGEKYPEEYAEYGDSSYGYYDLHLRGNNGEWIDIEVWGDKPNGHDKEGYEQKRKAKERFNADNHRFLGINYGDCFDEVRLGNLLAPYIGRVSPFVFDRPTDKIIQPAHWSNADELIEYCKEIAKNQPDGTFPTEEWLRKRGKWKNRDGQTYNTVSIYIKNWIGGVRKLREILNQSEYSTTSWSKDKALREYKAWFDKYGFTPGQARTNGRNLDNDEIKKANNISIAVAKYVGNVKAVNSLLNISPAKKSKWSKDKILGEFSRIFDEYSLTPSQVANLSESDRETFCVKQGDVGIAKQLIDRTSAYFSGIREVYKQLGIQTVDIRILRKRRTTIRSSGRS